MAISYDFATFQMMHTKFDSRDVKHFLKYLPLIGVDGGSIPAPSAIESFPSMLEAPLSSGKNYITEL